MVKMAYMKKNVNFGLILLLVAVLVAFAVFTTYYQQQYRALSIDYHTKLSELESLSSFLRVEKTRLNQTSYQLQIKQEREKDLSEQYITLKDEKETLEVDKQQLTAELIKATNDLAKTKSDLKKTENELSEKDAEIRQLEDDIDDLKDDKRDLCDKVEALGGQCG
jgi:uncharacterized protein (DUF3084 family)